MTVTPAVERSVAGLRARVAGWRGEGARIGLVPTMGALHEGHLDLVRAAFDACDRVAVSIFVNPTQFGPGEDFAAYPRQEARDLAALARVGADLAYVPIAAEMYPPGFATTVSVDERLTGSLCGATRPMHFQGVATVVAKLLLQCLPDEAWFGEKDFQQLQVIRRLAADLDIPVAIHGLPTVREPDGLAMSSRNAKLTSDERARAAALVTALRAVASRVARGEPVASAIADARETLRTAGFGRIDYLEIREEDGLALVEDRPVPGRTARVFAAAMLGDVRLIDNWPLDPV